MRPQNVVQTVIAALLTLPGARAADLTGVLSDYMLRKVPPTESKVVDMSQYPGMTDVLKGVSQISKTDVEKLKASLIAQTTLWKNPAKLNAQSLVFIYLYKLGPDYWTLLLTKPRQPLSDYMGTTALRLVGQTPSATPLNVYRVEGGRFSGFLAEDGVVKGDRRVVLVTPQVAAESPALAQYLK